MKTAERLASSSCSLPPPDPHTTFRISIREDKTFATFVLQFPIRKTSIPQNPLITLKKATKRQEKVFVRKMFLCTFVVAKNALAV